MDQATLVEHQIDDVPKLIDQLKMDHFDVKAAFWLYTSEAGQWFLYLVADVVDQKGITEAYNLRSAHLTRVFSEFPSSHQTRLCGWDAAPERRLPEREVGGSQSPPRAATEPDPPGSRRLGRGPPHHDASLGSVPSFSSRQVPPRCPSPRPKNFQNSSTRRPRRKCPRAQTAESEPATNPRSFRGDPLILPGKSHCFEPQSRLFPPFFAF